MKSLRILVPRPTPHLPRTLAVLRQHSFTHFIPLPLSELEHLHPICPPNTTALILPSIFALSPNLPCLPCYCVGPATAAAAKNYGFPVALIGTTNIHTLAQTIVEQNLPPQHFLHLHGPQAKTHWYPLLHNHGHNITPLLTYNLTPTPSIPPEILQSCTPFPTHTLLFSTGNTHHLLNLLNHANIKPTGTAIAFSPAVAQAAKGHWPRVLTTSAPSLHAMLQLLQQEATP